MIEDALFDAMRALRSWAETQPHVRRLWVFGSRLKGTHHVVSDLDVAMEIDAVGYDESAAVTWVAHHLEWERTLTPLTGYKVDLNEFDSSNRMSNVVSYISCCAALVYARAN
ncbi:putative nucleotidyltransferase [Paraburkholderia sp. WC7.3g]|uniref:nucleotidyltransferase family protein n=1 Tax=Paraburkholderia sp. WC7.3g TaxID=2991070 RepID=UPI003D2031C3